MSNETRCDLYNKINFTAQNTNGLMHVWSGRSWANYVLHLVQELHTSTGMNVPINTLYHKVQLIATYCVRNQATSLQLTM